MFLAILVVIQLVVVFKWNWVERIDSRLFLIVLILLVLISKESM
jgi:hypothetical protein